MNIHTRPIIYSVLIALAGIAMACNISLPRANGQASPAALLPTLTLQATEGVASPAAPASTAETRPDGAIRLTTPISPTSHQNAAFSPGGQTLLFTLFHEGYNIGPAGLYTLSLSGGNPAALLDEAGHDSVNLPGTSWNAATNRITFASDRQDTDEIWMMAPNGSSLVRVTHHTSPTYFLEPSFSPNGQWIVFEVDNDVPDDQQQGSIGKVRADGNGAVQLIDGPATNTDNRQPNWSPLGDRILFQRRAPGSDDWNLYTMAAGGSDIRQVTTAPSGDTDASWSPDGACIVYSTNHGGLPVPNIFVISANGGPPVRITSSDTHEDGAPSWSPDGQWIAFESHEGADETAPSALWRIAAPAGACPAFSQPRYPFPQHVAYAAGTIKPNHVAQADLDAATRTFYDAWKSLHLKNGASEGCGADRYYVLQTGESGGKDPNSISASEGHGYGMIITALMAGYDPNAKTYFDGLYYFFQDHPSENHPYLMAWNQVKGCSDAVNGKGSATDGDMDIAYALLLADKQWGSNGAINYLQEAISVTQAIMQKEVNPDTAYLMLGDWVTSAEPGYYYGVRTSDFILNHLRAYQAATGDARWAQVRDLTYSLVYTMQTDFGPNTGLLPDFIQDTNISPTPAISGYLEGPTDGQYYYNACRDPWRIGVDYLLLGDPRARSALDKINAWIRTKTSNDPQMIYAGYALDGTDIPGNDYTDMAFVAPLGVGAMVNANNQAWLNSIWNLVVSTPTGDYYGDTLKLLSMIVMSGNWWTPSAQQNVYLPLALKNYASLAGPLPLANVNYWGYQIQAISGTVDALVASHYDMLVLEPTRTDWSSNNKLFNTREMVTRLKNSKAHDGIHRKLVIAYIDIGQAEDWRWYWTWSAGWDCTTPRPADWPDYILTCDPDGWVGNYPVAYWNPAWKNIVITGTALSSAPYGDYHSILDEVIRDGFDGIYLDWVEGFENSEVITAAQAAGKDPAVEMIAFIQQMRNYALGRNPNFIVIQQNAAALMDGHPELFNVIDAIAQEGIWYDGIATDDWNDPAGYDAPTDPTLTGEYLGWLDQYLNAALPVFDCEYALNYAATAYTNSYNKGYKPYVTRRSLGRLTTTPPPGY